MAMEMRECLRKPVGSERSSHYTGAALAFQFLQSSTAKSAGENLPRGLGWFACGKG